MQKMAVEKSFSQGRRDALPTALGYISIGLAFGVVAYASGLTVIEAGLMSLMVYGGAAQFAMTALLLTGEPLVSVVLTCFLVNLRNMLMSLHTATFFPKIGLLEGIFMGSYITDESYGVLLNEQLHNTSITSRWMHGNNLIGYTAWFVATITGCLLGAVIPKPEIFGLDFALVAMFMGIFASQLEAMLLSHTAVKLVAILLTVTVTFLLATILVPQSLAVLLATLAGCAMGVMNDAR